MSASTMNDMVERLDRLEQECTHWKQRDRRWRRISGTAFTLMVLAIFSGASFRGRGDAIEAEKFLLRDKDGMVRAALDIDPAGTARFMLQDNKETPRLNLSVNKNGEARWALMDDASESSAIATLENDGEFVFSVIKHDTVRIAMGVRDHDIPSLSLYDQAGKGRIGMVVTEPGQAGLVLYAPGGKTPLVTVGELSDGSPQMTMSDKNGRVVLKIPSP